MLGKLCSTGLLFQCLFVGYKHSPSLPENLLLKTSGHGAHWLFYQWGLVMLPV